MKANTRNILIIVVVIILVASSYFIYRHYQNKKADKALQGVGEIDLIGPLDEQFRYRAYTCPTGIPQMVKDAVNLPEGAERTEVLKCIKNYVMIKVTPLLKTIPTIITALGLQGETCKVLQTGKTFVDDFVNNNINGVLTYIFNKLNLSFASNIIRPLLQTVVQDYVNNFIIKNHTKLAGPAPGLNCPEPPAPEEEWL